MSRQPRVTLLGLCLLGCGGGEVPTPTPEAQPRPPSVVIVAPDGSETYAINQPISVEGSASDPDSALSSLSFEWQSTLEGVLATGSVGEDGRVVSDVVLTRTGSHELLFQVEDPDALVAVASVFVRVEDPNTRPTVELDNPGKDLQEGVDFTLTGTVSDAESKPGDLTVEWELDGEEMTGGGPGTTGGILLEVEDPEPGLHTVKVKVIDPGGLSSTTELDFTVDACPDDDDDGFAACGKGDIDCDDDDDEVYPDADEVCDGKDNDCDGREDNGFPDSDSDGTKDCQDKCPNDSANDTDGDKICGDVDNCPSRSNPDQADADGDGTGDACDRETAEVCNGEDDDGDGAVDEDFTEDADSDGELDCVDDCPADPDNDLDGDDVCGEVDNCPDVANEDQADRDDDGKGDACDVELCNGLDDDDDGEIDEDFDTDGDGWISCSVFGAPYDCDDQDPSSNPYAPELCSDSKDNDCDNKTDEATDNDADGYTTCQNGSTPADCDDASPSIKPGGTELCDGKDNDCNGEADDGLLSPDFYEPNNTRNDLYSLGDLNDMTVSYTATVHAQGDSDWYSMELYDDFAVGIDQFALIVRLTDIPEELEIDLYVYWDEESMVTPKSFSTSPGNGDEYTEIGGESGPDNGGTYTVEVRWVSGRSCLPYTLYIQNKG